MAALADVIARFVLTDAAKVGCKVCAVFQVRLAEKLVLTLSQSQALGYSCVCRCFYHA
jgi:hypothetical protein